MNNEMKFEKNGLLIPNGALEELGLVGISLSAWLGQDHILLMPQEMTALQLLHALEGLSRASVELLGVLQEACRMPCAADCEKDMEDVPQVPDSIRPLLMLSGCCPSALAQLLEEGDIVYSRLFTLWMAGRRGQCVMYRWRSITPPGRNSHLAMISGANCWII